MIQTPPRVERLNGGRPIIAKREDHDWESKVAFNPACALLDDRSGIERLVDALPASVSERERLLRETGLVALLYRAQGRKLESYDHTRSSFGLAICSPRLELLFRLERPVLLPDQPYDDLGVEDSRVTRVGNEYCMIYTGYRSGSDRNRVRICIATSDDLVHWRKRGPLHGAFNELDNKNGMLFEPAPGGKLLMLHRPMEGENPMMAHWAEGESVMGEWKSRGVLLPWIPNPRFKDVWVGGGAPPLLMPDGRYLLLYHIGNRDANGAREYDLGLALCDPAAPEPILRRVEPVMRPETESETNGDVDLGVNNVVFVCGAYFWEEDLYFPYAGADSCVLGGRIRRSELNRFLQ